MLHTPWKTKYYQSSAVTLWDVNIITCGSWRPLSSRNPGWLFDECNTLKAELEKKFQHCWATIVKANWRSPLVPWICFLLQCWMCSFSESAPFFVLANQPHQHFTDLNSWLGIWVCLTVEVQKYVWLYLTFFSPINLNTLCQCQTRNQLLVQIIICHIRCK